MKNKVLIQQVLKHEFHRNDSLLQLILNKSPHFIGITQPPSPSFIMINDSGKEMFEMTEDGDSFIIEPKDVFTNPPSDEEIDSWRKQVREIGFFETMARMKTKTGHEFWGLLRADGLSYQSDFFELISISDITSYKEAELQALRDQQKFKTFFDNSTIGIVVTNQRGEITLINNFAEHQFGYEEKELLNQRVEKLIPQELASRHEHHRSKFMEELHNRPMGIGLDLYGLRKDGKKFPIEISLSPFKTSEGVFVIAFINDISIRKKNEEAILKQQQVLQKYAEEVRALNTQLEQRVEERTLVLRETLQQLERSREELSEALKQEKELSDLKSRFVSMASHEFRTPLSTILSSAALIEKYPEGTQQDKRLRHIHRIKENVKNLNDILEDFLSLGKLEEGLITPKIALVNVCEMSKEILHDMEEMKKPEQHIILKHTGKEEFVLDKHLMKNILINLLSNAIKFSGDKGIIEIDCDITDQALTVHVRDHGIGISKDDQQHLFDRFFRGKNATNIKGTGLGLHIVSKYVELLQGVIEFKSELNKGTEFIIKLNTKDKRSP